MVKGRTFQVKDGCRAAKFASTGVLVVVGAPQSMPLTVGARVFLYTDGVIEAPDQDRNLFGLDRLKAVLEDQRHAPLQELRTAVLDELRNHTGGSLSHDDVTLLTLEIR